jgi:hypothetical protein
MRRLCSILPLLAILLNLATQLPAHAETKSLTAEATYTMGDGESPSFAEAMVLQRAKQMALEQAGTYIESYTKVQNYNLTTEEIQTIAGGVLEVEVLEKTRTLVGDVLQFFIKIKATVTTDRMEDLARRIKGKNLAGEYQKLQEEYALLSKELDAWKQLVIKSQAGPEREAALDQIRERERAFEAIQRREASFFKRLVSGEALVTQAQDERATVDALFKKILEHGHLVTLGEPTSHLSNENSMFVKVRVPVTLRASTAARQSMEETTLALGGNSTTYQFLQQLKSDQTRQVVGTVISLGRDEETRRYFQKRLGNIILQFSFELENGVTKTCTSWPQNLDQTNPLYLAMNPIGPVSWISKRIVFNQFGNEDDIAGYWKIASHATMVWIDNQIVLIAGRDRAISPLSLSTTTPSRLENNSGGLVVIFDDLREFTVTATLPSESAKQIRTITSKFWELPTEAKEALSSQSKQTMGSTDTKRSWWQRIFSVPPEKDLPMAPASEERLAPEIKCGIEP